MDNYAEILQEKISAAASPNVAEFARKTGVNRKTVEAWVLGATPSVRQLGKIAEAVGCFPWELLKPVGAQPTKIPTEEDLWKMVRDRDARIRELEAKPADPLFRSVVAAWGKLSDDTQRKHIVRQIENLAGGLANSKLVSEPTETNKKPGKP